jgi:phospholipid/cholesterol/gamma-HCH transport system substrate-binding protein
METRPPTVTRILVAVAFALSCFGLLLFLWLAFGGPIPLKPESYRFTVPFDEATQLAVESDVRISGVSVGKVKRVDLDDQGFAEATIEVDERYAPIPSDTRAILRQKTLLGETYVELTPGSDDVPTLPEDGDLPVAQVSDAVQLDEIFRTFDDRTRAAFQAWMQGQAAALPAWIHSPRRPSARCASSTRRTRPSGSSSATAARPSMRCRSVAASSEV